MVTRKRLADDRKAIPSRSAQPQQATSQRNDQASGHPLPAVSGLEIRTLGGFRVIQHLASRETEQVPASSWRHGRTLTLVYYLLTRPRFDSSKESIRDELWPNAESRLSNGYLSNALWNLRKGLGTTRDQNSFLISSDSHVRLNVHPLDERYEQTLGHLESGIWIDFLAFEAAVKSVKSASTPGQVHLAAQRAFALYQGDFLPDCSETRWSFSLRERLREAWARVMITAAHAYHETSRGEDALQTLDQLLDRIPDHEEGAELALRLLLNDKRDREARILFERLRHYYRSVYGMEPPKSLRQMLGSVRIGGRTSAPIARKAQ